MLLMEELLTVKDIARVLKRTEYTVREMFKRGELVGRKAGRDWRMKPEDFREYLNRQTDQQQDK